jgi:hypothetical protein
MTYSLALTSLTLGLVATACGGFTEVGQGGKGGSDTGGASGAANQGGINATGGATAQGGSATSGGARATGGNQGTGNTGNAPSTGGVGGGRACNIDSECPRSLVACQLCDDGSTACPWARCESGMCTSGIDRCPNPNPCAGKLCGEACSTCAPDQSCPPIVMYCDDQGKCQQNEPTCGKANCKTDTDCPQLELCAPCADGSCADQVCLNGACQWSCDSGGSGGAGGAGGGATCGIESGSCANGETCCAGLECCAGVPVPAGNEYCGKVCPKSDQNIKRDFVSVDPDQVLDKLSRLPVGTWAYKTEGSTARHIGPMAQDFMAAFNVGSSDRTILQVDADGVSFAAIQALNARLQAVEEQNQQLQRQLDEQRQRCER